MKFSAVAFLLIAPVSVQAVEIDCGRCLEYLGEAQDCLRECESKDAVPNDEDVNLGAFYLGDDSGSLLNQCLDEDRGSGSGEVPDGTIFESVEVDGIDELVVCCGMSGGCKSDLGRAEECIKTCLDPCLGDTANAYFECIRDESDTDGGGACSQDECLENFLDDSNTEDQIGIDLGAGFDLNSLQDIAFEQFTDEDIEDCNLMEPFVQSVCSVGSNCCNRCQEYLTATLDCVVNDFVIPFTAGLLNETVVRCQIGDANGNCVLVPTTESESRNLAFERDVMGGRALQEEVSAEVDAAVAEATAKCENRITMDTIIANHTYAATKFMECVSKEMVGFLDDGSDDTVDGGDSAASTVGVMIASLVAIVGSFFAL